MTVRAAMLEQNSAYGVTTPGLISTSHVSFGLPSQPYRMLANQDHTNRRPYPPDWEEVAELRVFRTTTERWQKLIGWRGDMQRKGWKLLQVSSEGGELVAVFGRTRAELLARSETG